ncbi:hypothetical protein M514_02801 [Trichuris suis]|uniref:Uncharacterized protein n=1 Tax=Trichuris suis TaxID=68888 RepID=A0A085MGK0_9BILA|nr:hypothetical protein M513_02801 [Trichuris suis]KFD63779.1 hypothetical protein M514_02801 [Trichuris suis]
MQRLITGSTSGRVTARVGHFYRYPELITDRRIMHYPRKRLPKLGDLQIQSCIEWNCDEHGHLYQTDKSLPSEWYIQNTEHPVVGTLQPIVTGYCSLFHSIS